MQTNLVEAKTNVEELLKLQQSLNIFVNENAKIVIKSKAEFEKAAEVRNLGRKALKDVETQRKEALEPFDSGREHIQAIAKAITTPIKELVDALDQKMIAWSKAEQAKIESQNNKKLEKALEQGKDVQEIKLKEETKVSSFKIIDNWKAKVIDIKLVPSQYIIKIVDQKLLDALAKSSAGNAVVSGVEFYNDAHTSGRIS